MTSGSQQFSWRQWIIAALAAAAAATVVNVIYFLLATTITGVEIQAPVPSPEGGTVVDVVPLAAVIFASFFFMLIGAVVYGVVVRFGGSRADAIFLGIAFVALLLSFRFPGNYFDPTFPPESRWLLGATHLIAALVGVTVLLWMYRRQGQE